MSMPSSRSDYQRRGDARDHWASLLDECAAGAGGSQVIRGAPGFGKSTLLEVLVTDAEGRGFQVLRTAGHPLERRTSYCALRQLFEGVSNDPPPHAFQGASRFARPILEGGKTSADAFAVRHGFFWLLARLSETGPVAVVVDDMQWVDETSRHWLAYLAARIREIPAALVVAGRPSGFDSGAGAAIEARARTTTLHALTADEVADAVRAVVPGAHQAAVGRLHELTAGSPLLLSEMLRRAADTEADLSTVLAQAPHSIDEEVRRCMAELSPGARKALEGAALAGEGSPARLAALSSGATDLATAFDELLDSRLLVSANPIRFRHALVLEAVARQISAGERSVGHRAIAQELARNGAIGEAAAHLLDAEPNADPQSVDILLGHAEAERRRGAPEVAIRTLERALSEPPSPAQRPDVLYSLGEAELATGNVESAARHLAEAAATLRGKRRADANRAAARALALAGEPEQAVRLLRETLPALPMSSREAFEAHAELAGIVQTSHDAAESSMPQVRGEGGVDLGDRAIRGMEAYDRSAIWAGSPAEVVDALAGILPDALELLGVEAPLTAMALSGLITSGGIGWPLVQGFLARAEEQARSTGTTVGLTTVIGLRSRLACLQGRLRDSGADAELALRLATATTPLLVPYALANLVAAFVLQGRLVEAERVLEQAGYATGDVPATRPASNLLLSRMQLRSAQGRLDEAVADIARIAPFTHGRGPWPSPWTPDIARTLRAAGQFDRAEDIAVTHLEAARRWGAPLHLAEALSLHAEIFPELRIEHLEAAIDALDDIQAPLVRAKLLSDLGSAHRRSNARAAAREPLLSALELATVAGATPLVDFIRDELTACGLRPRRTRLTGPESLTGTELRIARLAASGNGNVEIAQQLFIARKTVENHLAHVFTKLQITSRQALGDFDL